MNVHKEYVEAIKASGFVFDNPQYDINVADKGHLKHMRKWCTRVPNK